LVSLAPPASGSQGRGASRRSQSPVTRPADQFARVLARFVRRLWTTLWTGRWKQCWAWGITAGVLWMTKESWNCWPKPLVPRRAYAVESHSPLKTGADPGGNFGNGRGPGQPGLRAGVRLRWSVRQCEAAERSIGCKAAERSIGGRVPQGCARPLHLIHGGASLLL